VTKLEDTLIKTKKLYDELSPTHQQELIRSITDDKLRVSLQDPKNSLVMRVEYGQYLIQRDSLF